MNTYDVKQNYTTKTINNQAINVCFSVRNYTIKWTCMSSLFTMHVQSIQQRNDMNHFNKWVA